MLVVVNDKEIRKRRIERNLTIERVGDVLDVSNVTVIRWEKPGTKEEFERIEELSWLLRCDVKVLFYEIIDC